LRNRRCFVGRHSRLVDEAQPSLARREIRRPRRRVKVDEAGLAPALSGMVRALPATVTGKMLEPGGELVLISGAAGLLLGRPVY
jgi:hypothetical protein